MNISKQFKQRLVAGIVGITTIIFVIYFSHHPFFIPFFILFNIVVIGTALKEYYQLAQQKGFDPLIKCGIGSTCAFLISVYLAQQFSFLGFLPYIICFISLFLFFLPFSNKQPNPLVNLAITIFGLAYLTIPLSFGLKINYFHFENFSQDGRLWLAYAFTVAKITDVGAYFIGKTFGKHLLVPHISPKKTIEGAIGGLSFSIIGSLVFYFLFDHSDWLSPLKITLWQSVWIAFCISLLAQCGDLAESILKRDAGVKDSSFLPGLGGMLDIVDSLVFPLPFLYFILKTNILDL